jgi:DnaJ family protein A protein 2
MVRFYSSESLNFLLAKLFLSGELKVIHGQGMPSQRHHEPGDMYVKVNVTFPEHIEPKAFPLLEQALPPRRPLEHFEKHIVLDEVHLSDPDVHARGGGMRDPDAMDEDEGEPRVQCANQ